MKGLVLVRAYDLQVGAAIKAEEVVARAAPDVLTTGTRCYAEPRSQVEDGLQLGTAYTRWSRAGGFSGEPATTIRPRLPLRRPS